MNKLSGSDIEIKIYSIPANVTVVYRNDIKVKN